MRSFPHVYLNYFLAVLMLPKLMELLPRSCAGACGRMWGSNQRKRFEDLLTHVDEDEKAKVVAEQVEVVGGCRQTYKLVDENLRQSLIQHCLWKETLDLHHLCVICRLRDHGFPMPAD